MEQFQETSASKEPLPTQVLPIHPWVAWVSIREPRDAASCEVARFSREFDELHWVYRQIATCFPIVSIDVELAENVELSSSTHRAFEHSSRSIQHLIDPRQPPQMVLIASTNRSDPIESTVKKIEERYPGIAIRILLGEWWVGHRRTWPLERDLSTLYWYQCHDRLLPDLWNRKAALTKHGALVTETGNTNSPDAASFKRFSPQNALIIADENSVRRLWLDVLEQAKYSSVAIPGTESLPDGQMSVVLVDCQKSFEWSNDQIATLRRTYPQARLIVCFDFPRWKSVEACLTSGADFIVGKPLHLEGILQMLSLRFSSAALPRK